MLCVWQIEVPDGYVILMDFLMLDLEIGDCIYDFVQVIYMNLSYDVASGSEITPCNKICKPLVVYRFTGNVMTFITTLRK